MLIDRTNIVTIESKISDDQAFYAMAHGLNAEGAVALIVNGFANEMLQQLPIELAVETQKSIYGSVESCCYF